MSEPTNLADPIHRMATAPAGDEVMSHDPAGTTPPGSPGHAPATVPARSWWRRQATNGHLAFDDEDGETRRAGSWVPAAMLALVVAAFLIRLSMAEHLSSHVDEAASIMAARAVAHKGAPVFPSGTLYLQGGTLSYVLAP
ncbi:MAG TPA: hypothetical protein VH482_33650, partial [Thermomicrobiales bacterium]